MDFSLVYLTNRFFHRLFEFVSNWYVSGFYRVSRGLTLILRGMDQTLAVRVTLLNLDQPLYGDYTMMGRVLGFMFRIFRLLAGFVLYGIFIVLGLFVYLFWALLPVFILLYAFR